MPSTNGATLPSTSAQQRNSSADTGATSQQRATNNASTNAQSARKPRISEGSAILMLGTALLFDVISIIPIVGQVTADILSVLTFFLWFTILGLPLWSPKKITTYAVSAIISVIPGLSALPEITLAILVFIIITRTEDKLGIQVLGKKGINPINKNALTDHLKGPSLDKLRTTLPTTPNGTLPNGQSILDGATPRTLTQAVSPSENPVLTLEEAQHFDASAPQRGATPQRQAHPRALQARKQAPQTNPQDEEIVTALPETPRVDSITPRSTQNEPQQQTARVLPFPGAGSQAFGRSTPLTRQDPYREAPDNVSNINEYRTRQQPRSGATPPPVHDDVS